MEATNPETSLLELEISAEDNAYGLTNGSNEHEALALSMLKCRERQLIRAQDRLEYSRYWYSTRMERMAQWAREDLTEDLKRQFFNIYANGTKEHSECPNYAQQFNQMKWRAEKAEARIASLESLVRDVKNMIRAQDLNCGCDICKWHKRADELLKEAK